MNTIKIDVIGNGYLLTFVTGKQEAFPSLDAAVGRLRMEFEESMSGHVIRNYRFEMGVNNTPEPMLTKSEFDIPASELKNGSAIWVGRLLTLTGLAAGSREARRLVEQGAVKIDGERVTDADADVVVMDHAMLTVGARPAVALYVEQNEARIS